MDNQIKVSVIIPTYNRCETIVKSVESVLGQSYQNLECIIVDDCSDDGTEDLIRGIQDERIKYIKNGKRSGAAKSRNIGCMHATGSVIGFNDSDDIWKEQKLSMQLEVLIKNDRYAMVYCPYLYSKGDITIRVPPKEVPEEKLNGRMYDILLEGNVIGTPTMLIKKPCFIEVSGFDENLKALEDHDFAIRVSKKYEIGYVDECLVDAYCTNNGVNSHLINTLDACIKIVEKLQCSSKRNGFLSLIVQNISLIEDQMVKNQMIDRVCSGLALDKMYLDCALSMSDRWLRQMKKERALITLVGMADYTGLWNQCFQDINVQNIAVYGCGRLGRMLAGQFIKTNIHFWGIIDRQVIECKGIPIYSMINIPEEIEAILITVYSSSFKMEDLAKYTNAKLVRLDDILSGFHER